MRGLEKLSCPGCGETIPLESVSVLVAREAPSDHEDARPGAVLVLDDGALVHRCARDLYLMPPPS